VTGEVEGCESECRNKLWRATTHMEATGTYVSEIWRYVVVRRVSHGREEFELLRFSWLSPFLRSVLPNQYCVGDKIEKNEMGGAYSADGGERYTGSVKKCIQMVSVKVCIHFLADSVHRILVGKLEEKSTVETQA
jgi:hypothetical protein